MAFGTGIEYTVWIYAPNGQRQADTPFRSLGLPKLKAGERGEADPVDNIGTPSMVGERGSWRPRRPADDNHQS